MPGGARGGGWPQGAVGTGGGAGGSRGGWGAGTFPTLPHSKARNRGQPSIPAILTLHPPQKAALLPGPDPCSWGS